MAELAKIPIETAEYQAGFAPQLSILRQHYTMPDNDHLLAEVLGEEPALSALLIEAVKPLQNAFGEGRVIQLRAQASDDDTFLKVAVQLPSSFGDAERALRSFDVAWWLDNCHRSGGALVFDYHIQAAALTT
jgi:hypothetical protein